MKTFSKTIAPKKLLILLLCCTLYQANLFSGDYVKKFKQICSNKDLSALDNEINTLFKRETPELNKIYHKLSLVFHPDKNADSFALTIQKEIASAYKRCTETTEIKDTRDAALMLLIMKLDFKTKKISIENNFYKIYNPSLYNVVLASRNIYYDTRSSGFQKIFITLFKIASNKLFPQEAPHNPYKEFFSKIENYNSQVDRSALSYNLYNDNLKREIKSEYKDIKQTLNKHLNRDNN